MAELKAHQTNDEKFKHPFLTLDGKKRGWVELNQLSILWFNTGTLCNITCRNCYIESSPKNDQLVYLKYDEILTFLKEIETQKLPTHTIGLTGGEPFMNPDIMAILEAILKRGFKLLVLTNAMRPMMRHCANLKKLQQLYYDQLTLRVSIDHYHKEIHESERGTRSWDSMFKGISWLFEEKFQVHVATRSFIDEDEDSIRRGFERFFAKHNFDIDAFNKEQLVVFPEMEKTSDVPEITTECWNILNVNPNDIMCATSRMVVKQKGDAKPSVMACTLLAYDQRFNMGKNLKEASQKIYLNHPFCSKFCVLGGGSCSAS
ncbi:MAG: radical SAM protein [Pseudomonadota bacterium]